MIVSMEVLGVRTKSRDWNWATIPMYRRPHDAAATSTMSLFTSSEEWEARREAYICTVHRET